MLTNLIAKLTGEIIVPLKKGSRSKNDDELSMKKAIKAGKPRKQAIAIALASAGKKKSKRYGEEEKEMKKGYHKTKSGKMAKKGLYYNINQRKKKGASRSKSKSTISSKAYSRMKSGFKKS
jgi:hypothetical protein